MSTTLTDSPRLKWVKSRCGRKLLARQYEICPAAFGYWRAILNPQYTPGINLGFRNGGRIDIGTHKTLAEAKAACERHAGLSGREAA